MQMLIALNAWLTLAPLAAAPAGQWVTASGEAQVKDGNHVEAKNAAKLQALRACIEQVVGITIQSGFTSTQREVVKNNQAEFYSKVNDELTQKSEGFIGQHEVVGETKAGDVIKVTVKAEVYESKLKAELQKLTDLIAAAGNPKLMLVLQEVYVAPDGARRVAQESLVETHLAKRLMEQGLELRGKGEARAITGESQEAYDAWLGDAQRVAALARQHGADIVIAGRIEINDKGVIDDPGALSALKGQTEIEISAVVKGINAATAELFSASPVQTKSIGTNLERAVFRAFSGRGQNLVTQLFDGLLGDLKASFRKMAEQGQRYVVKVSGIKSFRKQGRRFLELMEQVSGVSQVSQKSFDGGELVIDLACKCSTQELQDRIFGAADKDKDFAGLDVSDVAGKQLSFKL